MLKVIVFQVNKEVTPVVMNDKRENSREPLRMASDEEEGEEADEDRGHDEQPIGIVAAGCSHSSSQYLHVPGDCTSLRRGPSRNRFRSVLFNSSSKAVARPPGSINAIVDAEGTSVSRLGRRADDEEASSKSLRVHHQGASKEQYSKCEMGDNKRGGQPPVRQKRANGENAEGPGNKEEEQSGEDENNKYGGKVWTCRGAIRRCADRVFQCRTLLAIKGNETPVQNSAGDKG